MAAHQAPPSLRFSRQEYWSGLPFPSPMHACMLSHFSRVWLCATPWTAADQAPLSTGFSSPEYWSGLHFLLHQIIREENKRRGKNTYKDKSKTKINKMAIRTHILITALNVNGLNTPTKRHREAECIQKQDSWGGRREEGSGWGT